MQQQNHTIQSFAYQINPQFDTFNLTSIYVTIIKNLWLFNWVQLDWTSMNELYFISRNIYMDTNLYIDSWCSI